MMNESRSQTPTENRFCLLLGDTDVTAEASGEYTLPDYLPDIRRILRVTAFPQITGQYMNGEKAEIEGTADAVLLYMSEEGTVHAFHTEAPFAQTVPVPGMDENTVVTVRTRTDSSTCRLSGPRKLTMRHRLRSSVLTVGSRTAEPAAEEVPAAAANRLCVLHIPRPAGTVCSTESEEFRYSEDLSCTDGILKEILTCEVTAIPTDTRFSGGRIVCKGEFRICALTSAEDSSGVPVLRSLSGRVPFTESIPADGASDMAKCIPDFTVTEIKSAVGDNGRNCAVDFSAELSALCLAESTVSLAEDAFSPGYDVRLEREDMTLLRPVKIMTAGISAAGTIKADPSDTITEICDTVCRASLDQHTLTGNTLQFSGQMEFSCVGKTGDAKYLPVSGTVPLRWETELPELKDAVSSGELSVSCVCRVLGCGCQPASDGHTFSCDCELSLLLTVLKKERLAVTTALSASPEPENKKETVPPPPILICYPQPGETVWEIAKHYRVSPDALRARNGLSADAEPAGNEHVPLFIPTVSL